MSLAPSFNDLDKKKLPSHSGVQNVMPQSDVVPNLITSHQDLSYGFSKITIIGTGGAGKTAAVRYAKTVDPESSRIITIDTSGVPSDIPNVESIKIKDLNGSGKLRKNCIEPITNFVADFTAKTTFELVNVIVCSMAGGSGSVLAPLLVDEILRQSKIAIVIGIIDTDSEVDTVNAFNCIKTFDNIATNRKAYLPMMLFNNSSGRSVVDAGIDQMLKNLHLILSVPYVGLDIQDRIKFFAPGVFDSVDNGVKLLNVSRQADGEWEKNIGLVIPTDEHEKLDAMMIITHTADNLKPTKRCSVIFRGYYEADGENIIASIGYQIPTQLIKELNAEIHAFKSTNTKAKTVIDAEYSIGETDNRGMVL